jgi:hypothetical protein
MLSSVVYAQRILSHKDVSLSNDQRIVVNIAKGMQGNSLKDNNSVVAEPKHFGVVLEGGNNTAAVFMGERDAREMFFTFEKAIKEGHACGVGLYFSCVFKINKINRL